MAVNKLDKTIDIKISQKINSIQSVFMLILTLLHVKKSNFKKCRMFSHLAEFYTNYSSRAGASAAPCCIIGSEGSSSDS
jgi:hypothetical protein